MQLMLLLLVGLSIAQAAEPTGMLMLACGNDDNEKHRDAG